MAKPVMYFTLDTISDLAFGRRFGDMENNKDMYGYIEMIKKALPVMNITGVFMWLSRLARSPLLRKLVPSENDRMGLGKVMGYVFWQLRSSGDAYHDTDFLICRIAKEMVGERFGPDKKIRQDMLGSFVKHGLTQEELESETMIQMYWLI